MIWTVIFGIAFTFFKLQNAFMKGGIRPPAEEELAGLDMAEMGALAYPEFVHHEQLQRGPGTDARVLARSTSRLRRRASALPSDGVTSGSSVVRSRAPAHASPGPATAVAHTNRL